MISAKIQDLLVEIIIYTKSITVEEFKQYKETRKDIADKDIWKQLLINYYFEYMSIVEVVFVKKMYLKKNNII